MMGRGAAAAAAALALAALAACDFDETLGLAADCGEASGAGLDCDLPPVETPEDACWKMVECAAIPAESSGDFDWARCASYIRDLPSYRQDFTLACIDGAQCDELKFSGSPESPSTNPANFPPCLQHGEP